MGEGSKGDVYIRSEEYGWIPARIVEQDKNTAKVAIPQYDSEEHIMSDGGKGAVGFKSAIIKLKDYANNVLPLQNVGADGKLNVADDMVDLPYLHEVSLAVVLLLQLLQLITERHVCFPSSLNNVEFCYFVSFPHDKNLDFYLYFKMN